MANFIQKFINLFKKEDQEEKRREKENTEIQRLNELHEKASKNRTKKKKTKSKSKPVNYNF